LTLLTSRSGELAAGRSVFQSFTWAQQRLPDRRQGRVEVRADGAAALIPARWGRAATTRAASSRACGGWRLIAVEV
jgi:hypothetical protein